MKLGLIYDLRNPERWAKPWPKHYGEFVEHVAYMEQLGFELLELPEHHFDPDAYIPNPIPILAALAVKTQRILLGSNLFIIPNHHPVRLAEDVAMVDILSNGRVVFKAGAGGRRNEPPGLGFKEEHRFGRNTEGMEIIKRCWTEEVFDFDGHHYKLKGVRALPKPVQKPHPPIFMPAMNLRSMERNVRLGYGANMGYALHGVADMSEWKQWHKQWTDTLRKHSRAPDELPTSSFPILFATDDPERAWNKHKEGILHVAQSYATMMGAQAFTAMIGRPPPEKPEDLPNWNRIFLTPDDCVKHIQEYYGDALPDHLVLWGDRPGMTLEESAQFHQTFIEKVWPRIRDKK